MENKIIKRKSGGNTYIGPLAQKVFFKKIQLKYFLICKESKFLLFMYNKKDDRWAIAGESRKEITLKRWIDDRPYIVVELA